jgi:hypothetical protein
VGDGADRDRVSIARRVRGAATSVGFGTAADVAGVVRVAEAGRGCGAGVGYRRPPENAREILDFTNALSEYVITFRDKFEAFQKRREQRAQPLQVDFQRAVTRAFVTPIDISL